MREIRHFIPAREASAELPLQRYLDPLPADVVGRYLECYTRAGELALDPLAQRPALPLLASVSGRKALAGNFNPISTLLIEGMLTLPQPEELDAATTQLGDSPKRGVTLREHINRLYASTCENCSSSLSVDYFLWDGEQSRPLQKRYQCPSCGLADEFPVEDEDLLNLERVENQGVHYWYLLDRLAQPHEPERQLAEELLQLYTPRNLYALADLSMKIEALFPDSPVRVALQLVLLSCLDTCSKLAGAPIPRAPTMHLQPPSRFVERNVWQAFEEAYRLVRRLAPAGPLRLASRLEDLMEGNAQALVLNEPVRRVAAMLPPASVALVIAAPQAYYRPFWTLSYLWSGWLWGRHKAALLKPLLRRKTMGWSWYRRSLAAALRTLHRPLRAQGNMIFLLEGADLAHVTNLILASVGADFKLDGLLYQPQEVEPPRHPKQGVAGAYRLAFSADTTAHAEPGEVSPETLGPELRQAALRAMTELLRERGQALHLSWLHAAAFELWAREGLLRLALALDRELSAADLLQQELEAALDEGLESGLLELVPEESDEENAPQLWWLRGQGYPSNPLGDRLEGAVLQALQGGDGSREELEETLYARFPGLFTPQARILDQCITSYGRHDIASGQWLLREEDTPQNLAQEREGTLAALATAGSRLGYQVRSSGLDSQFERAEGAGKGRCHLPSGIDLSWEEAGTPCHLFAIKQTARFGDLLAQDVTLGDEARRYIVLCERRLDLLRFRMDTEVLLTRALADGCWRFIKFRTLQTLAATKELHREDLEHFVGLEPLVESPDAQLPLFS